jgi:4-carboxymuconolactone decarboxylase
MRHRSGTVIAAGAVVAAMCLTASQKGSTQTGGPSPAMTSNWPADIDAKSGMRLPIPNREDLDEAGKRAYDRSTTPGASIAGLQGPGGVQLYSTKTAPLLSGINRYLRYEAGFSGRVREIAILITAREMDSQFEWVAHEPEALKEGVPQAVVDVIKHRRSTDGLPEADAIIIEIGRQIWRDHKVKPDTFAKGNAMFGPNKLVELVMLMGSYAGTAALLTMVDMQLHKGSKPMLPIP